MTPPPNNPPDLTPRQEALSPLQERIRYQFDDIGLLERALCHSSMTNAGKQSYERLEFLGDSILGFVVADYLYHLTPEIPEGRLTDRRAQIVSRPPLAQIAADLSLPSFLEAGRGLQQRDLESPRIHADLVEAVLGAIFLDGGIEAARRFVHEIVLPQAGKLENQQKQERDSKSRILHFAQVNDLGQPTYRITKTEGPDHERIFTVAVVIQDEEIASGRARTKQAAEMEAAELAIATLSRRIEAEASSSEEPE